MDLKKKERNHILYFFFDKNNIEIYFTGMNQNE